jgi:extracellular factor (EF) 3-hydroxypalmitic acid methyl ester biosynthesis protein
VSTKSEPPTSFQSLVTFRNSQGETARGTILKVERGMAVFEVYNPYSIVQLSEVLSDFTVNRTGGTAYRGRAVVSNLVNTGLMLIVSVTLDEPWSEPLGAPTPSDDLTDRAERFLVNWDQAQNLRPGFRVAVTRLRSFFADLNAWIEQALPGGGDANTPRDVATRAFHDLSSGVLSKMRSLVSDFLREAAGLDPSEVPIHSAYTKFELHPFIMRAPFPYRTYHKPLGYAGDYEMMNMIHNNEPEGPNVYAQLINRLYTRQPMALCVRNRVAMLEDYIRREAQRKVQSGKRFRMISVGCGPAVECERFIRSSELAESCVFDLVDFNEQTLSHAEKRITSTLKETGKRVEVNYIHNSVHGLLKQVASGRTDLARGCYDLAYCAGLFDYLSDRVCARLTRAFVGWLAPGGVVIVTNMHSNNVDQYIIELKFDWFLIYRDEAQMEKFYDGLGRKRLFVDETGVNLCLEVRIPELVDGHPIGH